MFQRTPWGKTLKNWKVLPIRSPHPHKSAAIILKGYPTAKLNILTNFPALIGKYRASTIQPFHKSWNWTSDEYNFYYWGGNGGPRVPTSYWLKEGINNRLFLVLYLPQFSFFSLCVYSRSIGNCLSLPSTFPLRSSSTCCLPTWAWCGPKWRRPCPWRPCPAEKRKWSPSARWLMSTSSASRTHPSCFPNQTGEKGSTLDPDHCCKYNKTNPDNIYWILIMDFAVG